MSQMRNRPIRHWFQIHWPNEEDGHGKPLHVWVNKSNLGMKDDMTSGDRVLFYQTKASPEGYPGSGRVFATGTVAGSWIPVRPPIRRGGTRWLHKRPVDLDIRVHTHEGIPAREASKAAGGLSYRKSARIEKRPFRVLETMLKKRRRELESDSNPPQKYCRICWNSRKWKIPTGEAAELEHGTWVAKHGFGHEEWLFNFGYLLNGLHYAHLQPVWNGGRKIVGRKIHLRLYSRSPKPQKGPMWVGGIRNCKVITEEEAQRAKDVYRKKGWLREMSKDLARIKVKGADLHLEEPLGLFNVCFKPGDAYLNDSPEPVPKGHLLARARRYELFDATEELKFPSPGGERKPPKGGKRKGEGKRKRSGQAEYVVDQAHNRIQNQLADQLEDKYGKKAVTYEKGYVDLALDQRVGGKARRTLFEIKTEPSARMCIRQALGQLLEYCCYPAKCDAQRLIVVGPAPCQPEDLKYLAHVRKEFGLPVGYWQYDVEKQAVVDRQGVTGPDL